jgi:hypothetical protein
MIRSRLGLLGLCAMVLGLMAFNVTAAEAETNAKWLYAEKAPNSGLVAFLEATIGLETDVPFVLHMEIAKTKVLVLCSTIALENAKLKANGSIGEGAKIKLSGCTVDLNNVLSKACEPHHEGKEPGVIRSRSLHGLLVLHELAGGVKDDILSILPDNVSGLPSEVIFMFDFGPECSIGTLINIIGKLTFKDCEGLALTHLVKHLWEAGPLTELWAISKTAEHVMTILGSAWASLTGAHAGLKFSGDPA